jgi:hypothetical protein
LRQETVLTVDEVEILRRAQTDPDIFTQYFFRPFGDKQGFEFDYNFAPEGAWQKLVHSASQKDITVIGGFGTGKTLGVGIMACVWSVIMQPDFKFLNVAPKAWQAFQMYDQILKWARNTRFEDMIWEKPRKPHPKIIIRYRIGRALYESSMEFMSADRDATGILSWEGDWINIDEAGQLDNLEEIITYVGSRLRGSIRGRERLGRFSMMSNSWDNYDLWEYFDRASDDPENFLSIVVSSRHNNNITPDQLAKMLSRIPKDERERFIDGTRPEGRGQFFSKEAIYECEDPYALEIVEDKVEKETPHYVLEKIYGAGVIQYRIPPVPHRVYLMFGDPGVGGAPRRNAPTLMVWDATQFPSQPANLVAFWWGNGGGKIAPFVDKLMDWASIYKPVRAYIDSTSVQKNMAYLINEHIFREKFKSSDDGISQPGYLSPLGMVSGISGMDFSGAGKNVQLQAARLFIENHLMRWPKFIVGIRSQLSNYDPEKDRKIAQDIVATFAMSCHGIRGYFHVDPQDLLEAATAKVRTDGPRYRRLPESARNRRSPRETSAPQRIPTQAELP